MYWKINLTVSFSGKTNTRSNVVDRSWKKNYENAQEIKSAVSSPASTQTAEANEESFATASEGSDSEETAQQMSKSKSSVSVTKRSTAVVVAKAPRKNFRSSSRLVFSWFSLMEIRFSLLPPFFTLSNILVTIFPP